MRVRIQSSHHWLATLDLMHITYHHFAWFDAYNVSSFWQHDDTSLGHSLMLAHTLLKELDATTCPVWLTSSQSMLMKNFCFEYSSKSPSRRLSALTGSVVHSVQIPATVHGKEPVKIWYHVVKPDFPISKLICVCRPGHGCSVAIRDWL